MSSSHDKSLRLWERTREPIILDEEREMVRWRAVWTQTDLTVIQTRKQLLLLLLLNDPLFIFTGTGSRV